MNKIKKNDEVIIISGKDRGQRGKVETILLSEKKLVVGGLNLVKRHLKRRSEKEQSQIVTIAKPLDAAKVMVVCPHCNQGVRVGFITEGDRKVRQCKKCKKPIS